MRHEEPYREEREDRLGGGESEPDRERGGRTSADAERSGADPETE